MIFDIPANLFKSVHDLRVVDLSHNRLKSLPEYLFPDDGMESYIFLLHIKILKMLLIVIYLLGWIYLITIYRKYL